jgi:hypothetical protein
LRPAEALAIRGFDNKDLLYRYRLSILGRTVIALAFKLKDFMIIPELAMFAHP